MSDAFGLMFRNSSAKLLKQFHQLALKVPFCFLFEAMVESDYRLSQYSLVYQE